MDNQSTFLELPLDRDLYKPKVARRPEKPPLRVLITEIGSKIGVNVAYKISTGEVFGPDQGIILHLISTKGSVIQQRAFMLDLEECGSSVLLELVASGEPDISYGNVDIVILVATFEEVPGHPLCNSFLYQLNKCRNVAKYTRDFAKPDTKLVVCGPSTKGVVILLDCIRSFEPELPRENITGVTCLDETIAKAIIGAKFKTTTNNVKNVVIWGATLPDVYHATVSLYLPGDMAMLEKVETPVMEALDDHTWIHEVFVPRVFRRILHGNLAKHGMSVAAATARHLRILHEGTQGEEEIVSMAVIAPKIERYGINQGTGFSLPTVVERGAATFREETRMCAYTQVMVDKLLQKYKSEVSVRGLFYLVKFIKEYEERTGDRFVWTEHSHLINRDMYPPHILCYLISPNLEEQIALEKTENRKKSIVWEDSSKDGKSAEDATKVNFRKKSKRRTFT